MDGDDEPLHVVITGEDQTSVDVAASMIEDMLVVIDDEKNVHKQQQLRELALLNGTLKDEEYCHLCAEKGHRSFECPRRFAMNIRQAVHVKCAICGDTSHPTRDCAQKPENNQDQKQLDSDYQSFMAELDGKKPPIPAAGVLPVGSSAIGTAPSTGIPPPIMSQCIPVPSHVMSSSALPPSPYAASQPHTTVDGGLMHPPPVTSTGNYPKHSSFPSKLTFSSRRPPSTSTPSTPTPI